MSVILCTTNPRFATNLRLRHYAMFTIKVLPTLILLTSLTFTNSLPALASAEIKEVCASSVVKAPASFVWDAIQHQRKMDAEHKTLVSYHDNEAVMEEEFFGLPIIGAATCLYKESEIPVRRINYAMISSNRFKLFEGAWILSPSADGQSTTLYLSSSVDPGVRVPFWKELSKMAATHHIKKRLDEVREDAENSLHQQHLTALK